MLRIRVFNKERIAGKIYMLSVLTITLWTILFLVFTSGDISYGYFTAPDVIEKIIMGIFLAMLLYIAFVHLPTLLWKQARRAIAIIDGECLTDEIVKLSQRRVVFKTLGEFRVHSHRSKQLKSGLCYDIYKHNGVYFLDRSRNENE